MKNEVVVDQNLCIACHACIEICPRDCFITNDENKPEFKSKKCHSCGHCISVCPENAITHSYFNENDYQLISDSFTSKEFSVEQMYAFLKSIRSTRQYLQKEVDTKILEKLVDLSRFAPTGHHAQNVELVVVSDPKVIQQLKDETAIAFQGFLKKIDSPIFRFFGKLFGKGQSIKRAQKARHRFIRMLNGFKVGRDYLFHGAPVVIILHALKTSTVPLENCTIASDYIRILAETTGLGSCHIGYLTYASKYNPKILKILEIPSENEIYQVLALGYPKHNFHRYVARKGAAVNWL